MYEEDMMPYEDMTYEDMNYDDEEDDNNSSCVVRPSALQMAMNYRLEKERKEQKLKEIELEEMKNKEDTEQFKKVVSSRLNWLNSNNNRNVVDNNKKHDDAEYPDLLSSLQIKQDDDSWTQVKVKTKKQVSEKEKQPENTNIKSKMCNKGVECKRGSKCDFAHTRYELKPLECFYENCKNVRHVKDGKYINKYGKCERLHKGETMVSYYIRNNLRENMTIDDMNKAYEEYENNSRKITSDQLKLIESLPCNKYIMINDIAFFGKQKEEVLEKKVNDTSRQHQKYVKFVKRVDYYKQPRVAGGDTVVSSKKIKYVKEDAEKVYIREKNRIMNEIKSLKTYITSDERALDRLKTNKYDVVYIKKREDELKNKMKKLKDLEKELSELKVKKEEDVIEDDAVVDEIIEEVVEKKEEVVVEKDEIVITIISNTKREDAKIVIPEIIIPMVTIDEVVNDVADDKWKLVVKKERKTSVSSTPVSSISKVTTTSVVSSFLIKTQMCRSVENKTPCPHGKNCRYAHKKEELVQKPTAVTKTQMCKSITQNIPCPHGAKCRYAHNFSELKVHDCSYGRECKMVNYVSGEYRNSNVHKTCCYKHPEETKINFMKRNNF